MDTVTNDLAKKTLTWLLRTLMLALAIWLVRKIIHQTGADIAEALKNGRWSLFALALAIYGMAHTCGSWRWDALLRVHNLQLGLWTAFRLTLLGSFFSLVMPGAVTGDVLKVAVASRRHPGHALEFALVDLLDRILGLCGLLIAAALLAAERLLHGNAQPQGGDPIQTAMAATLLCGMMPILLYALYCLRAPLSRIVWLQRSAAAMARMLPQFARETVQRLDAALALYDHKRGVLLAAVAISIVIHILCLSGVNYAIGQAIGEHGLSYRQYALTTQLSNATGIVAITPGGIGLRDMAAADLYRHQGAAPGECCGAIPLINSLVMAFWGLIGAILSITLGKSAPQEKVLPDAQ